MQTSKGAPLRALLTIVAIWVFARIIWEAAFPSALLLPMTAAGTVMAPAGGASQHIEAAVLQDQPAGVVAALRSTDGRKQLAGFDLANSPNNNVPPNKNGTKSSLFANIAAPPKPPATNERALAAPVRQILQMQQGAAPARASKALSGYFWVFARQSGGSGRTGPLVPIAQSPGGQYGGSQAGAILTYRLAGASRRSLSAFVRASTALSDAGQEEVAIGIKAHPFAGIPLSLFAEQRAGTGRLRSRGTAVYAAGGTGPDMVFPHTSLETYGQAGFVFANDSSYFFDVSADLQRKLWAKGRYKFTAGAGVWAGGQKGLRRVDIGPRANIHIPVGTGNMRFSLDWRQRVGGNAVPDSGVAMTVTTGF